VYQLRPGLLRVRVLVASRGQFSGITVVQQAYEGRSVSCVPRVDLTTVVCHAAGVKMEPVKVDKVTRS
jgi:hypothetical protein